MLAAPPPKPEDYEHRLAGIRAHNRWLVDFCAAFPSQRAGIGQIFINNLEDALADAKWIAEHGLRGGLLLPNNPPDATWIEHQIYDPYWEPLWDFCEEADLPVNIHGGTGVPDFGKVPVGPAPLHRGVRVLPNAALPPRPAFWRVRAPPPPPFRHGRNGGGLVAAPAVASGPVDHPDQGNRCDRASSSTAKTRSFP